jgi:hypothetical protein
MQQRRTLRGRALTLIAAKRSNLTRPFGTVPQGVPGEPMMESITLMVPDSALFARKGGVCAASAREENVA